MWFLACLVGCVVALAGCGGDSAGGSSPAKLAAAECKSLDAMAIEKLVTLGTALSTGEKNAALEDTVTMLRDKREAYDGGCITKRDFVRFLIENENTAATYNCPRCVDSYDRQLAAVGASN